MLLGLLRLQVKVKEKNREFFKYLQKLRMARASDDNLPWQRLVSDSAGLALLPREELSTETTSPVSYTHLTLPTTPYV